jgi:hypothetical protein
VSIIPASVVVRASAPESQGTRLGLGAVGQTRTPAGIPTMEDMGT